MDEIEEIMISSDNSKLLWIKNSQELEVTKMNVAKSIESDEIKIQTLDFFESESNKRDIIVTLKSDDRKIEVMRKYLQDEYNYQMVIESLSSPERKIDNLYLLTYGKRKVIDNIQTTNDEQRLSLAKYVKDERLAIIFIEKIEDEGKRIQALELLSDDYGKAEIIKTLQSDRLKIEQLNKLEKDLAKAYVIQTFEDEQLKVQELKNLKSEFAKTNIIEGLKDYRLKIQELEKLSDDFYKETVIKTLPTDELKIQELAKLEDEFAKASVISVLDSKLKLQELSKLQDEFAKAKVISTLEDTIKIQELQKLKDEFAKAEVISTLNDELRIQELEKLENELAKANVIEGILDNDFKLVELGKMKNDFAKSKVIISLKEESLILAEVEKLNDPLAKAIVYAILEKQREKATENIVNPLAKAIIDGLLQKDQRIKTGNILNDREKLKEILLNENRKYTQIGLDPEMTIGMEIESEGAMSSVILALEKEEEGSIINWKIQQDNSLQQGAGVEVASPVLTDNTDNIEDIYMICSMLERCEQKVSGNCGGHIHIESDYLKSKGAYINLFEIWGNTEKILCKICNEKGNIPRIRLGKHATNISPKLNEAIEKGTINIDSEEQLDEFIESIQEVQKDRHSGLNLLNINNGKNTIEFRIPNGTINPDTWIENVRLFGRIVMVSQKIAEIEQQTEKSEEDEKLIALKESLKDDISEQEKLEILLEMLFTEEERDVYRERYIENSRLLEEVSEEENPLNKIPSKKIDFRKKEHCIQEFYEVTINDRSSNIDGIARETVQGIKTENELEVRVEEQ